MTAPVRGHEATPEFSDLIAGLMPKEGLRVWSVLVTIFGDLAIEDGATLNSSVLTALTAPLEIRPEALRVAIHRLKKDGWLISERAGRSSNYGLSDKGRAQSQIAGKRIYGQQVPSPKLWKLAVQPLPHLVGEADQGIALQPGLSLFTHGEVPPDAMVFSGQIEALPDWVRSQFGPADLAEGFHGLDQKLAGLSRGLHNNRSLSPLETAAIRVLIVHEWRRLLLRQADVPEMLLPKGWPGLSCRHRVFELLALLPRPEISALSASLL